MYTNDTFEHKNDTSSCDNNTFVSEISGFLSFWSLLGVFDVLDIEVLITDFKRPPNLIPKSPQTLRTPEIHTSKTSQKKSFYGLKLKHVFLEPE